MVKVRRRLRSLSDRDHISEDIRGSIDEDAHANGDGRERRFIGRGDDSTFIVSLHRHLSDTVSPEQIDALLFAFARSTRCALFSFGARGLSRYFFVANGEEVGHDRVVAVVSYRG